MAYEVPIALGIHQPLPSSTSMQKNSEYQRIAGGQIVSPTLGRRRSAAKIPGLLKRAVSSPNVRSLAVGDTMAMSAADKKRNKLGYHRTAVACGHCRRRKIRCIPAFDDNSGRCQNCIRLKKDCHFFPVDQQAPGPGKRARSGSKVEGFANEGDNSVSSSSPGVLGSSTMEQIDQVNGQINTPPLPQGSPGFPNYPGSGGPVGQHGFGHSHEYEYHHSHETQRHPLSQYSSQSSQGYPGDRAHFDVHGPPYFHPPDPQVLQGSFPTSSYASTPLSGTMSTTPQDNSYQFSQQSPHGDFAWQPHPPIRSLSIADGEDLANTFGAAYRANTFPTFGRRMNTAPEIGHLPSANNNMMMMHPEGQQIPVTISGGYHSHSIPYHHMNPHNQAGWPQHAISHSPQIPISAAEAYGQPWGYPTGPPGLSGVREEEENHGMSHGESLNGKPFRATPG